MDKEMIEYYHDIGLMPDWWYYQVNGKSAEENYLDMVNKRDRRMIEEYQLQIEREQMKRELEKDLESKLEETLEKALNELLKDFNT